MNVDLRRITSAHLACTLAVMPAALLAQAQPLAAGVEDAVTGGFYGSPVAWGFGLGLLAFLFVAGLRARWEPGRQETEVFINGQPYQMHRLWGNVQAPGILNLLNGKILQLHPRYVDADDAVGHALCAVSLSRRHWPNDRHVAIFNRDTQQYRPCWSVLTGYTMPVNLYMAIGLALASGLFTYGLGAVIGGAWIVYLHQRARRGALALAQFLRAKLEPVDRRQG